MTPLLFFCFVFSLPQIIQEIEFYNAKITTIDAQLIESKCESLPLCSKFRCCNSYITVWDCGEHGKIKSDLKSVWRHASTNSTLLIKKTEDDVRICGILKNE